MPPSIFVTDIVAEVVHFFSVQIALACVSEPAPVSTRASTSFYEDTLFEHVVQHHLTTFITLIILLPLPR